MTIKERINFLMSKAKFELSEKELSKFEKDLQIFIEDIKILDSFNLENILPIRQPFNKSENLLRDDEKINNNNLNFIENTESSLNGHILLKDFEKGKK